MKEYLKYFLEIELAHLGGGWKNTTVIGKFNLLKHLYIHCFYLLKQTYTRYSVN